jgi:nucleotide-binding universal stress UspA family protein
MSSSLAKMQESILHITHVWDFLIRSALLPQQSMDIIAEEVRTMHKSSFDKLLRKHVPDLPENQIHLVKGEAGMQIPPLAKEKDIDLIVMGTVSRTGIPGLFIGNTAEKILYRVDCSVLAVKPDGFITPVRLDE